MSAQKVVPLWGHAMDPADSLDSSLGNSSFQSEGFSTPRILIVTSLAERFVELPVLSDVVTSVLDAQANILTYQYTAIFIEAVLPDNQSGYRLVQDLRRQRMITVPIFIMVEHALRADKQLALQRGATGLIAKNRRALIKALEGKSDDEVFAPSTDPSWLPQVIAASRNYLASEAERIVRKKLDALRVRGTEVTAETLIHEVADVLDDDEDRTEFVRNARRALK
jgi:CheY-like chemotaxis protein